MYQTGLRPEETDLLRAIYRRDVNHWGWSGWLDIYRKFGEATMGLSWVLLPYKFADAMPVERRQMNEIYYECLEEHAKATYGLSIRTDDTSHKIILCSPDWLA